MKLARKSKSIRYLMGSIVLLFLIGQYTNCSPANQAAVLSNSASSVGPSPTAGDGQKYTFDSTVSLTNFGHSSPALQYQQRPWPTLMGVLNGIYQPAPITLSAYTADSPNSTSTPLISCGMYGDSQAPWADGSNSPACIKSFVVARGVSGIGASNVVGIMGVAQTDTGPTGDVPQGGGIGISGFGYLNTSNPNAQVWGAWFMGNDEGNPGATTGVEIDTASDNPSRIPGNLTGVKVVNYGHNGGGTPPGDVAGDNGVLSYGYGKGFIYGGFQSNCKTNCFGFIVAPSELPGPAGAASDANTTAFGFIASPNPYKAGIDFTGAQFQNGALVNPSVGSGISSSGSGMKHVSICASNCTVTATPCVTNPVGGSICSFSVQWPGTPFNDSAYSVTCTGVGTPSGVPLISTSNKSRSAMNVQIQAAISASSTFPEIDCTAIHN